MRRLVLSAIAAAALASGAHATADGPDAWRVVGVSPSDVLNVRVGPGTGYFVISALPHNARGIQLGTCVPTVTREQYFALSPAAQQRLNGYAAWCVVIYEGQPLGWVNRRFLTEDGG
ncbi:SH3 domain-containing protein [Rhodobacterales bacterium HKCCSP123]|nr:SH3 domain-containing protein [Rhodobacterales bacterium HKCCSP123]